MYFDESEFKGGKASKEKSVDKFAYLLSRVEEDVTIAIVLLVPKGKRGPEKEQLAAAHGFISWARSRIGDIWAAAAVDTKAEEAS